MFYSMDLHKRLHFLSGLNELPLLFDTWKRNSAVPQGEQFAKNVSKYQWESGPAYSLHVNLSDLINETFQSVSCNLIDLAMSKFHTILQISLQLIVL